MLFGENVWNQQLAASFYFLSNRTIISILACAFFQQSKLFDLRIWENPGKKGAVERFPAPIQIFIFHALNLRESHGPIRFFKCFAAEFFKQRLVVG